MKEVLWRGSVFDWGGYSQMNREICWRLARDGWKVRIDPLATGVPEHLDPETRAKVMPLVEAKLEGDSFPLVVGFTAMPTEKRSGKTFFYTMTESQKLHPDLVARCNAHADEVWVPATFHEKSFKASGVAKPVRTIPLGVDTEKFKPGLVPPQTRYEEVRSGMQVKSLPRGFRFMSLFAWNYHKGPDILMRAFLRSFTAADGVHLVVYSRYGGGTNEACRKLVRAQLKAHYLAFAHPGSAPVYLCMEEFSPNEMPGLYSSANCFVSCSRGEGFGLGPIEAAACGVPVVCAYNSGMEQYLSDDVAFLVRSSVVAPADSRLASVSPFFVGQPFPVLDERSALEFGAHMKRVVSNGLEAAAKASNFRHLVLSRYTWEHCVAKVEAALEAK